MAAVELGITVREYEFYNIAYVLCVVLMKACGTLKDYYKLVFLTRVCCLAYITSMITNSESFGNLWIFL